MPHTQPCIDSTLDEYVSRLPSDSLTCQAILREEAWGEIAAYARGEGLHKLAEKLEQAELAQIRIN